MPPYLSQVHKLVLSIITKSDPDISHRHIHPDSMFQLQLRGNGDNASSRRTLLREPSPTWKSKWNAFSGIEFYGERVPSTNQRPFSTHISLYRNTLHRVLLIGKVCHTRPTIITILLPSHKWIKTNITSVCDYVLSYMRNYIMINYLLYCVCVCVHLLV